jgi:tetratricopeptide (TPR) repeat protein
MRVRKATRDALLAKVRTRLDRFVATQDPAVVLATVAVGEVGDLLKTVPNPAADLEIMATAGFLHWFRYQALPVGEDQEDLLAALMFFEPVYRAVPEVVPEPLLVHLDPARISAARARELLRRTEAAVDPAALDEAVDLLQQAVAATPKDHPRLPVYLGDLDDALERRFELKGEWADIDAAVDVCRRAVAAVPVGHPDRAGALSNLGNALGLRFERGGDPADLEQAIEAGSAAEAAAGADHPARVQILANLGSNLVLRADRDGTEADVRAAVGYLRQAAELLPPSHPARPSVAANLARALYSRWELRHDSADLAESIRLCQEALAAVPPGHPKQEGILLMLSKALHDRGVELMAEYRDSADLAVLNAAVLAFTNAAAGLPVEHPIRRLISSALCTALTSRYERTGDPADLGQAVAEGEQACADPALRTAHALSNLSTALRRRYERDGQVADLDRAIDAGRQAVAMTKDTGPDLASLLSNLGGVLQRRFERTGEMVVLNEAIETFQRAVAADRNPVYLGNLGIALLTRFERDDTEADLRNAIETDREALRATPVGHPDRARRLISLSNALIASAGHGEAPGDLDEAIRLARGAQAALPGDYTDRGRYHNTLANALIKQWERTESAAHLEEAISEYRRAADALPADHPDQAIMALNLGEALRKRFRTSRARADLDQAIALGRAAARQNTAPTHRRARAARLWGLAAADAEMWEEAAAGYATAVNLLPLVTPQGMNRADQEYWLSEMAYTGSEAAACHLQAGLPERAVELWEQGRGVLLSQALDSHTDLSGLSRRDSRLAAEFTRIRDELDGTAGYSLAGLDRLRQLAADRDRILTEIRSLEGFAHFLRPLPVHDLLAAAEQGPIALVNVTYIRSDALLLTRAGVQVVPLPELTPGAVVDRLVALKTAVDLHDVLPERAEQETLLILRWLWQALARPVLEHLNMTGPVDGVWPRLWWCPGGPLAYLPLHAAADHTTRDDQVPQTVLDRAVSSYTPTVRALIRARLNSRARPGPNEMLVVAMPNTPEQRRLRAVVGETLDLHGRFPGQVTILHGELTSAEAAVLHGSRADTASVLAALSKFRWAHFACHATSDMGESSVGELLLADHQSHPLTVADLARLRLPDPELAFLSACATVRTGRPRLADEAIHLSAGFQLAGYRHVVATLWPIDDKPARQIATRFYERLAPGKHLPGNADAAALTLHETVRAYRDAQNAQRPWDWAAYLHSGA